MTYLELARKIKSAYKELKQNEAYKLFNVIWNNDLGCDCATYLTKPG